MTAPRRRQPGNDAISAHEIPQDPPFKREGQARPPDAPAAGSVAPRPAGDQSRRKRPVIRPGELAKLLSAARDAGFATARVSYRPDGTVEIACAPASQPDGDASGGDWGDVLR